jgi:hypothetical protein
LTEERMSETEQAGCPIPEGDLSPNVLKNVGAKAPGPLKMMTARGLAPLPPRDLVTAQFVLTFDADEKIAQSASGSLSNLDARIANAVLADQAVSPHVLGFLAQALATNDAYAEKLLLNPKTPSLAFVQVAEVCSEAIAEIIANNQARILEVPEIARGLSKNPNALKSSIDRVIDFLVRNGVILDGLRQFEEALLRLNGDERAKAAAKVALPSHLVDEQFLTEEEKRERRLIDDDEEAPEEEQESLHNLLRNMSAAQKVAAATKGTKAVRSECLRDTNRLVALAAITSPAITEQEVIAAAQSRTVHQDVIAHICRDKQNNWVRNYQVKNALVNNPKTPLPEAMRLVPSLNPRDLRMAAKSRNIPAGVRNLASKLVKTKTR